MKRGLFDRLCSAVLLIAFGCTGVEPTTFDNLALGNPGNVDVVIDREGFAVGFSNERKQALWVIYKLTADELAGSGIERSGRFRPDPEVPASALPQDYTKSGYDRGHLAPARDMGFSRQAMKESFLMSNITPQLPEFNRGIWKRLEEQVRRFALAEKEIYVVTGTIFDRRKTLNMKGPKGVPVPDAFFKVVYDLTPPEKMIGFLLPHDAGARDLRIFIVTVDQMEELTGLDFFSGLPDDRENRLEVEIHMEQWNWLE